MMKITLNGKPVVVADKPQPSMLGSGGASKAAEKLKPANRKQSIEDALKKAGA